MLMCLSKNPLSVYSPNMNRAKILAPSMIELTDSLVLEGDVAEVLPRLPDQSVQCAVTSPPYWGLRDYGIEGQIGLEPTLAGYINKLTSIFAEVRRVLKPDGILWLNMGDGFTSGNRGWRAPDKKNPNRAMSVRPDNPPGLKDKDLLGVPWRLAFALQADGWFLRSDIVWHKPNAMPESVKDRPTRAHEYVFMLTKEEQYSYSGEAVMEDADDGGKRNRRSVWSINTAPTNGSHIAGFPQELIEPCLLSSTKPDDFVLDPFFGSGTVGLVALRLKRKFIGVELNPGYLDDAMRLLERQAQTAEPLRRRTRYLEKQNGHHPTLLETPGKRRHVS
jgi:site-specific DNA-methyltransferase (adenine-specific)